MSEELNKLKKKRSIFRTSVSKLISKLETEIAKPEVNIDDLGEIIEILNEKANELRSVDSKIEILLSVDDLEEELSTVAEYQERMTSIKYRANRKIQKVNADRERYKSVTPPNSPNEIKEKDVKIIENVHVKLPKLTISKFYGDTSEWLTFWNSFSSAIHKNETLNKIDKFNYLRSFLGGTAYNTIEGFALSAENYDASIKLLTDRFGNKEALINTHIDQLLKLNSLKNSNDVRSFRKLFDNIQKHIRSLESLQVTSNTYGNLLCPLLLKLLPSDLVLEYNKKGKEFANYDVKNLVDFLSEQLCARENAFGCKPAPKHPSEKHSYFSTASNLLNDSNQKKRCMLCDSDSHFLSDCKMFWKKSLTDKRDFLLKRGICFVCFKRGHTAKICRSNIKCSECSKRHFPVMCSQIDNSGQNDQSNLKEEVSKKDHILSNKTCRQDVLMQTLIVRLINKKNGKEINIRALVDTGSGHSYLSQFMANKIGYVATGKAKMNHSLFGGLEDTRNHNRYKIHLSSLDRDYFCNFDVYDQKKICSEIPKIKEGAWIYEAKECGINLSDLDNSTEALQPYDNEIHVLIGADVCGKLFTGNIVQLKSDVVAMETRLGWTLMGKVPTDREAGSGTLSALTLFSSERKISDLWDLDVLGITDPAERQTKRELEEATEEHFLTTLRREPDGRYEVSLPWLSYHPSLPTNRQMAEKRLISTVKKLKSSGNLQAYEDVFKDWEDEGIIETVDDADNENCHYLPHRAVLRENSTTRVRPVFDASAKEKSSVSLNECLESGPNYLELIPSILNRFRVNKYGVIADIRKAFLQISVNPQDRDFLRFLWWENGNPQNLKIYRHKRVVFGINASPFLLAATLNYHLDNVPEKFQAVAKKLKNSYYVDNCVTSVRTAEELDVFIAQSREIMSLAMFDLRGWRHNCSELTSSISFEDNSQTNTTDVKPSYYTTDEVSVLGVKWNVAKDTLKCNFEEVGTTNEITKRKILSIAHKIFDPIGFTIPVTLIPKLILQQCWKLKLNWDTKLPVDIEKRFTEWVKNLENLKNIEIPRKLPEISAKSSLHVFCDASSSAYATCIFLRSDDGYVVNVQLVQARAKVAPLKPISMPRLELLSCNIGARLAQNVKKDLKIENIRTYYWSDSTDVIYWIKKDENWATFVLNRVKEIRSISEVKDWYHIPGKLNPADIPSRGCSVRILEESRWWEGPQWLYENEENWPVTENVPNFEVINSEKRKTVVSSINTSTKEETFFDRFSDYNKIRKIISWILRFTKNCKLSQTERNNGKITVEELKKTEIILLRLIQKESFKGLEDKKLSTLQPVLDSEGLVRIKSRISRRNDLQDFRFPIVLPSDHPLVFKLIRAEHENMNHAGVQNLMSSLREKYWILKCRRTVRKVVQKCIRCKRFSVKPAEMLSPPLPEDRIRDANVFEVIGVDLCGPLFLKDGGKVWIVLFTCAVFRAIHLEITTSLSSDGFLQTLRRFIARRGRPHVIYSDNGSNFIGARRELNSINWDKIKDYSTARQIEWKMIPPAAPWWGGFWERLIGILKSVLRKIIGKASLKLEELYTIICDAESIINSRPLTYISEDPNDLIALTPEMFLKDIRNTGVPDLDNIDKVSMNRRFTYRQKIREDLRQRFRSEYLGFLREIGKNKKKQFLKEGDVVLIDDGSTKRIHWPLAKVIKLYPGKDGHFRLAKLKTKNGEILRPCQRLCPLELQEDESAKFQRQLPLDMAGNSGPMQTRYGRTVRPVDRLGWTVAP